MISNIIENHNVGALEPQNAVPPNSRPPVLDQPLLDQQVLEEEFVKIFKLLSDETRFKTLLFLLREGELHVTALCQRLSQSQPAVSHHLALLRSAGLIEARRDGKHNFYSVTKSRFHQIFENLFNVITDEHTPEFRFGSFVVAQGSCEN